MKQVSLFTILIALFANPIFSQNLISADKIYSDNASSIQATFNYLGINTSTMNLNSIDCYKIVYSTIDVLGDPTIASGAVFIPLIDSCDFFPIVSYQHGTEFDKTAVPSNSHYYVQGELFSANGYIVAMPDYLGMGDNTGVHPYHHAESQATASVDLIRACQKFIVDSLQLQYNNQLFLTGYSQGGHATMSIHKGEF